MSLETAHFTRDSFASLLRAESLRCVRKAIENKWLPPVPEALVYYFPSGHQPERFSEGSSEVTVPVESILSEGGLLTHLFREEDGHFRAGIVLSPFALTDQEIVVEVSLSNPNWTNQVITGKLAFPHEPFQLNGPRLPASWKSGDPILLVSLPRLRTSSTLFRDVAPNEAPDLPAEG
jgi:hypothetical protein